MTDADEAKAQVRELLAGMTPLDPGVLPRFANVKTGLTDPPPRISSACC